MGKHIIRALVVIGLVTVGAAIPRSAAADEKNVITLKPTTVVGRYNKPSVVIEVSRAKAEVKLAALDEPAVEKVLRAATKSPF